ncbi:methylecgonone reductase-like [Fagus crenata]
MITWKLGLEYVDLYLIHFPMRVKQGIEGTWEATEECYRLGLAKSVGVSNFGCKKLSQLLHHATIPPAVNQQEKLRHFCKEKGIQVSAWSPLGANGASWGTLDVMESPVLKDIAVTKEKSVPQARS